MAWSRGASVADENRFARTDVEASAVNPLDETRNERRPTQKCHERRGSQEPGGPAEKIHLHTVATEMPIHQQRDNPVVGQPLPDLKRGIERSPHFHRVDTEGVAHVAPESVHFVARLSHRDDGQRKVEDPPHGDSAELPVPVVTAEEDDAAPLRQKLSRRAGRVRARSRTGPWPLQRAAAAPAGNR